MSKKLLIAGVTSTVVIFVFEFLVHGLALAGMYEATAHAWRPFAEMESLMWFSILIQLATAFAMACYMSKWSVVGCQGGARFGSMIGVLMGITQLGMYSFLPIEMTLPLIWAVAAWVKMVVVGAAIGYVYR